jgi:hypothetical protein
MNCTSNCETTSLGPYHNVGHLFYFILFLSLLMRVHRISGVVLVAIQSLFSFSVVNAISNHYGSSLYPLIDLAIIQRRAALHHLATRSVIKDLQVRAASALTTPAVFDGSQAWRRQKTPGRGDVPSTQAQGGANIQFLVRPFT